MDAITMTNSGKPIGRCPEDTQLSALTSDKKLTSEIQALIYRRCCVAQPMFRDGCQAGEGVDYIEALKAAQALALF
jgi:hypothetical protein